MDPRGRKAPRPANAGPFAVDLERREWDSNPRTPYGVSGFQDRCNQPLCHPSGLAEFYLSSQATGSPAPVPPSRGLFPPSMDASQVASVRGRLCPMGDTVSVSGRKCRANVRDPFRAAPPAIPPNPRYRLVLPGGHPRGRPAPASHGPSMTTRARSCSPASPVPARRSSPASCSKTSRRTSAACC